MFVKACWDILDAGHVLKMESGWMTEGDGTA